MKTLIVSILAVTTVGCTSEPFGTLSGIASSLVQAQQLLVFLQGLIGGVL